jgi:Domain of unknown function (DUF4190)/Domain of unknown function (DUF1707)
MGDRPQPQLRASDADRENAAERLRQACLEGRLESDELEGRLGEVYAARWTGDLQRLTADVTPPPAPPAPVPYAFPAAIPETNGLAIASLTAGILWLGWLGSIAAVIFGHVALAQIKRSNGRETGQGLAVAGLVLGWLGVGTLLLIVLAAAF